MYEEKKKTKAGKSAKDESEIDNTNAYLLGNQIISSCRELQDFMNLTAAKQQLLMKLTGVDKVSADI